MGGKALRDRHLVTKCTASEKRFIEGRATAWGRSQSNYVRACVMYVLGRPGIEAKAMAAPTPNMGERAGAAR